MKRAWSAGFLIILVGGAFLAGASVAWRASGKGQAQGTRKILHWVDPMHPSYTSDKPGVAPDCGMQLEPVYAGAQALPGSTVPAGALQVTPEKQQTMGVTTGVVERTGLRRTLRTVGRVAADENRVYRLVTTIDGWVKQVFAGQTGGIVARDQVLLHFYSREFLSAQAAYFYALDARSRFHAEGKDSPNQVALIESQVRTAAETLQGLGMDELQLAEIARTRKAATEIALRSPTTGYIVARNVYPRQRFERGTELYRIVDVSRVWVLADLFESDAQYVRPGTTARVSFPYQEQGPITARAGNALPQFDPASRTLKLRLEADNPAYALRPDMLVDVELDIALPEAVTVPADAVVDSGSRKTVFVDRGNGTFEPRRVETGWRLEDRVEVVRGLMPGERIVLSGNFLLDSESRMRTAAAGIVEAETDPVCGMAVDQGKAKAAGRTVSYHDQIHYFCSDNCRKQFEANPARYAPGAPSRPETAARTSAPVPPSFTPPRAAVVRSDNDEGIHEAGTPTAPRTRGMGRGLRPRAWPATPPPSAAAAKPVEPEETEPVPPVDLTAAPPLRASSDPACGITVDEESATAAGLRLEHQGRTYYFVSKECKELFAKDPDKYVKP
jgi:membrane fusion protein, copper/silver efflux system